MGLGIPERPGTAVWPRLIVGRVEVDLVDTESALSLIMDAVSTSRPLAVASANLDHIYHFSNRSMRLNFDPAAESGGRGLRWLTLLDGMPLVRKANSLTKRQWPKLSGSDLIAPILQRATPIGARVGFLGGMPDTHRQLSKVMAVEYSAVQIAGMWAPTRSELTNHRDSQRIASEIHDADVDILVVALGKPLQENWITQYGRDTGADVLLAFGAVVDFLAGRIRRAPTLAGNLGAEWAWRLLLEPRRLSRRYLIQGPPALVQLEREARIADSRP